MGKMSRTATVTSLDSSGANVVDGFSRRFNVLLDRAGVPQQNRVSIGAVRFNVVHNTFKNWCEKNKIPGSHAMLVQMTEGLLEDVPGRFDPQAVVAWLLTGDAVPNPFHDNTDALAYVELFFQISDVAKGAGVVFNGLPRDVRNVILRRVWLSLQKVGGDSPPNYQLDDRDADVILGMIEAAMATIDEET